jgi:acyl-homoserine-lactone acylase
LRFVSLTLVLCAGLAVPLQGQQPYPSGVPRPGTEILWDNYGVPHIYGRDSRSMFYAFGWAQMQSHGNLLLRLYGQARGRAAEYWGKDYLESDRWVWINNVPERADQWWRATRVPYNSYIEAFVAGLNAYAIEHMANLDSTLTIVLPLRPQDVLAHGQRVIHTMFVTSTARIQPAAESWRRTAGSNAWAIGPRRSASGRALLLANPHLPWGDVFTWYEAQLVSPDVSIYGATLVGQPFVSIAFNDDLGWTHTVNTIDAADLFELTLAEGGYRWNGAVRPFDATREILRVREGETFREDTLQILRSVHGPVIARTGDKALALRIAGLDQPHQLEQYWRMARSHKLKDFERALAMLQTPMFTVMYADKQGHIMHLFGGRVPVRAQGDWAFWSRPVRGDTSATLWTRTHPYSELPRVLDPDSSWLQNANDPPWTTTFPLALDPSRYPPYLAPPGPFSFRPQRSARMLREDTQISFEEMIEYKHSTKIESAVHILDEVMAAARRFGTPLAQNAAEVLARWDRSADANSRGAVLFQNFMEEAAKRSWPGNSMFAARWSPQRPFDTPDGLSDAEQAAALLDSAAQRVQENYGALDVRWGDVYRLRIDLVDLPSNGAPGELGSFRAVDYERAGNRYVAVGGDSYVAAIEFGRRIRAMTLLTYGNASQPGSPHRVDQLPLFEHKQLKPALLRRDDVMKHMEQRKRF